MAYQLNEKGFEEFLEALCVSGGMSPASIREKISRDYGRLNGLYRKGGGGTTKSKAGPDAQEKSPGQKGRSKKQKEADASFSTGLAKLGIEVKDPDIPEIRKVQGEGESVIRPQLNDLLAEYANEENTVLDAKRLMSEKYKLKPNEEKVIFPFMRLPEAMKKSFKAPQIKALNQGSVTGAPPKRDAARTAIAKQSDDTASPPKQLEKKPSRSRKN